VLSLLFRRLFLEQLQNAFDAGKLQFYSALESLRDRRAFVRYLGPLKKAKWSSMPSGPSPDPNRCWIMSAATPIAIAISNNRLLDIEADQVSFRYKDYRDHSQQKTMTLSAEEFIRRFLLHVLPHGFHRIRYYGFLGNRNRQEKTDPMPPTIGHGASADASTVIRSSRLP